MVPTTTELCGSSNNNTTYAHATMTNNNNAITNSNHNNNNNGLSISGRISSNSLVDCDKTSCFSSHCSVGVDVDNDDGKIR